MRCQSGGGGKDVDMMLIVHHIIIKSMIYDYDRDYRFSSQICQAHPRPPDFFFSSLCHTPPCFQPTELNQ